MIRASTALTVVLLAGCTGGPGASPDPGTPAATVMPATTATAATAVPATPAPTATPSPTPAATVKASPEPATVYSPDDERIASLIRAGADEAIPQLKALNASDPQKLEDLFLPLGRWIDGQRTGLATLVPTTCTAPALEAFDSGLTQYDAIRKQFLAWRDWGANGNAFPPAAPGQAVKALEEAIAELEAHCPT